MTMSPKVILLVSICLNAGLGIAYFISPKSTSPESAEGTVALGGSASSKPAKKRTQAPQVVTNVIEPEFHWREVEAADYKEYIRKLRGIGCPEATIRDIIIADIDKLYEPRLAQLRDQPTYRPDKYWMNYYSRPSKRDPAKVAQEKAIREEREALIKELLGVEEKDMRMAYSSFDDSAKTLYAYLPEDVREKLKELDKKFNEARSKIYAETGGYIDGDTQKELAEVRKKMMEEMKGFMSPEQIFEYDIRTSDTARNMRWELQGFDPTEEEFRTIFAARKLQEESRYPSVPGERPTQEQLKAYSDARKQAQDTLKASLGEDRFKEMEVSRDYGYRQLVAAGPHIGFDKSAAIKVFDLKADAEKAANELRRNNDLTSEQKNQALQEIRAAAEAAVSNEIGDRGFKYYRSHGGYWFNNLGPRNVMPTTR